MAFGMPTASQPGAYADVGFSTPWSRAMGLRVPIVNAPMGGVAGGPLAAAVTAAGGLGMIGMGSSGSAAALRRELDRRAPGGGPFGIGLVDWVLAADPDLLEVAIDARPALIAVGFGAEHAWVDGVRAAGIRTATQVYSAADARRAEDAGVELLVARGSEGGGHGSAAMSTLPLLDAVLSTVSTPVLAAGGIGSPASLAAVLVVGAAGAWLGTHLAVCPESDLSEAGRRAMLAADGADTVLTTLYDIAFDYPWPARFPARVLATEATRRWAGREESLRADPEARAALVAAIRADPAAVPVDAGQGVGMITSVAPVAEVIGRLCAGAVELLVPSPGGR